MIKDLVDVYTGLIQLLLLGLLVLGCWLEYKLIPNELTLADETFKPNGFVKVLMAGGATFLAEAILFGPFLVVMDIRTPPALSMPASLRRTRRSAKWRRNSLWFND